MSTEITTNTNLTIRFTFLPPGFQNGPLDREGKTIVGVVCSITREPNNLTGVEKQISEIAKRHDLPNPFKETITKSAVCCEGDTYNPLIGAKLAFIRAVRAAFPHKKACSPADRRRVRSNRSAVWNAFKEVSPEVVRTKIPRFNQKAIA